MTFTSPQFPRVIDVRDPRDQITAVSRIDFVTVPLLNREEARLLPILEWIVRVSDPKYRVMAQTPLGEVIRPKADGGTKPERDAAFFSVNSKRIDFAIIDRWGTLRLAVEYQGSGHYHTESFMRDAVKREALRKAGVVVLEVTKDFDRDIVVRDVCRHLNWPIPDKRAGTLANNTTRTEPPVAGQNRR